MQQVDVLIVGAGFAGLRALYRFRKMGKKVLVLEASDGVGGVWYHNGYPGARCDVESYDYSYSFSPELEQEWRWSERYATQPEILRYIDHVADRFDLRRDIRLNTRMESARYVKETGSWEVKSADGQTWTTQILLLCMGQLSQPKTPDYPGLKDYAGRIIHSGVWPKEKVDFTGKRVAVIGTGSSGMQMTPVIAQTAAHVTVFQRSPAYSVPAANAPLTEEEDRAVKASYAERRMAARNSPTGLGFKVNRVSALDVDPAEREKAYEAAYHRLGFGFAITYHDILTSLQANETAAEFIRRKTAARLEKPALRQKLIPSDHPFAARRPSVDSGYFEAFNRDNVDLADLREFPIIEFTREGIRTGEKLHRFDIIIFATGFDVFTGSLLRPLITGPDGTTLKDKWAQGPVSNMGVAVAGFPNLLIVAGPGSPSLLSNVMISIEDQVDWFADLLRRMDESGARVVEADGKAQADWMAHMEEKVRETIYMATNSYYNGSEIAGKPRVFMPYSGGVRGYRRILEKCAEDGYPGFRFGPAASSAGKQHAAQA